MMKAKILAGALSTLAIAGAGVFALHSTTGAKHPATPKLIVAQSDQLLPSTSLTDWSSFADHLATVTVTAERKLSPSPDEVAAGEGYIPRVITLRVDSLLWSRTKAPAAPASFDIDLDGWMFHGSTLTPTRLEGEPMMTVGKQYVMPIVYLQASPNVQVPGWSPLAPDSIIPVASGVLGQGDVTPGGPVVGTPRAQFDGNSAAALTSALKNTAPYAAVANQMNLPPDERAQLVPS